MSEFIKKSPRRQLEEELQRRHGRSRPPSITAGTWLGYDQFRCGSLVREKGSRHIARIDAILWSVTARVTFLDTGWRADIDLQDLELAKDE